MQKYSLPYRITKKSLENPRMIQTNFEYVIDIMKSGLDQTRQSEKEANTPVLYNASGIIPLENWAVVSTSYNWTNLNQPDIAMYFKDVMGIVHLKGSLSSGTCGVMGTLPEKYRPVRDEYFPVTVVDGSGVHTFGSVQIDIFGKIEKKTGNYNMTNLYGITFRASNSDSPLIDPD